MSRDSLRRWYRLPQCENQAKWLENLHAAVLITTVCNRKCVHCCYRDIVRNKDARHFSTDNVLAEITALSKAGHVGLMGGEPTLHPDIEKIIVEARKIRGKSVLNLVTNGARLLEIADTTQHLDAVLLTVYEKCAEDSKIATEYQKMKPPNVSLQIFIENHAIHTGKSMPCPVIQYSIAVMNGQVYPCCGSVGIANAESTPLSEGWEERLLSVEAPCERCVAAL